MKEQDFGLVQSNHKATNTNKAKDRAKSLGTLILLSFQARVCVRSFVQSWPLERIFFCLREKVLLGNIHVISHSHLTASQAPYLTKVVLKLQLALFKLSAFFLSVLDHSILYLQIPHLESPFNSDFQALPLQLLYTAHFPHKGILLFFVRHVDFHFV